jgi:transposase
MLELDFTKPAPRVETLEEAQALIDQLWQLLGRQEFRIKALEERLHSNSRNSSKPPSTDHGGKSGKKGRVKSGKKAGGQPGHVGKGRELVEK